MTDTENTLPRRRAILDSAAGLFDSRGYAETTIEEIAEGAGISKGSVYNYFRSKHDLFTQLFDDQTALDQADVDRMTAEPGPAAGKIGQLLDLWYSRLEHYRRVGRLTLEFWATAAREPQEGEITGTLHTVHDRWLDRIARIIQQGIDQGEFHAWIDPRVAAALLMGVTDGLLVHIVVGIGVGVEVDELFMAALKRSVLAALGAQVDKETEH